MIFNSFPIFCNFRYFQTIFTRFWVSFGQLFLVWAKFGQLFNYVKVKFFHQQKEHILVFQLKSYHHRGIIII